MGWVDTAANEVDSLGRHFVRYAEPVTYELDFLGKGFHKRDLTAAVPPSNGPMPLEARFPGMSATKFTALPGS
jgi:hypothetical protein